MCHTNTTPYTLKAQQQKIGTPDFINNCVYIPVNQVMAERKNTVNTLPTENPKMSNNLQTTENTGAFTLVLSWCVGLTDSLRTIHDN